MRSTAFLRVRHHACSEIVVVLLEGMLAQSHVYGAVPFDAVPPELQNWVQYASSVWLIPPGVSPAESKTFRLVSGQPDSRRSDEPVSIVGAATELVVAPHGT